MIIPVEDADRAEALLREDVEWAVRNDRWDPGTGAYIDYRWNPQVSDYNPQGWEQKCACAIGTMCIRRNLPHVEDWGYKDVRAAAAFCNVPYDWMRVLYLAVAGINTKRAGSSQAHDLGRRLVAFAETLKESLEDGSGAGAGRNVDDNDRLSE